MGRRGPPRKPASVRQSGRKSALYDDLRVETPRPTCPAWLSLEGKREWRRVLPFLQKLGLLTALDRAALANYCESWSEWVRYQADIVRYGTIRIAADGTPQPTPWVRLASEARDRMMRAAAQFGFSPSARVGLKANVGPPPRRGPPPKAVEDTRAVLRVLEGGL